MTRHEQHAAFMAATYGRLTGRAGVCLSTLGPGATNLLTGVAHAQLGGMPLVAITGQKPLRDNNEGKFQLIDVVDTFAPLTKWNSSIAQGSQIPRHLRHAFATAESSRPGAVHLELPEDVAGDEVEDDLAPHPRTEAASPIAPPEAIERAAAMIREARTPIIIAGSGAAGEPVCDALHRLVSATDTFLVTTQMAKGALPEDHPQSLLCLAVHDRDYVHGAVDRADLVITLGYDIVEYPPAVWNADRSKKILHVDAVHAEPDEFYAPAFELLGQLKGSLVALCEALEGYRADDVGFARLGQLMRTQLWNDPESAEPGSPSAVVRAVRRALDRRDIVCLDNGLYKLWFARNYAAYAPQTLLLDNALATMGAGLGAAMAAKLVYPERRVLAVCGDGGS